MPWLFLPVINGTISTTELLERQGERNAAVQVVQSVQHVRVVNPGSEAIGGRRETFVPTLLCVFLVSQMRVTLRLNSRGARALRAGPRVCPNTLCWRRLPISCVHQIICLRIARPRMAPTVEGKA